MSFEPKPRTKLTYYVIRDPGVLTKISGSPMLLTNNAVHRIPLSVVRASAATVPVGYTLDDSYVLFVSCAEHAELFKPLWPSPGVVANRCDLNLVVRLYQIQDMQLACMKEVTIPNPFPGCGVISPLGAANAAVPLRDYDAYTLSDDPSLLYTLDDDTKQFALYLWTYGLVCETVQCP